MSNSWVHPDPTGIGRKAIGLLEDALRDAKRQFWTTADACNCPSFQESRECWHVTAERLLTGRAP